MALAALGALLPATLRSSLVFAIAIAAGVLALWLLGLGSARAARWVPIASPSLAWLSSAGLVTAYRSGRERAARGALMQLFARRVSPELADEIWRRRDSLLVEGRMRPQRLTATVLLVDMKGYTARADPMGVLGTRRARGAGPREHGPRTGRGRAEEADERDRGAAETQPPTVQVPEYRPPKAKPGFKPPLRGTPSGRVGGGSRSAGGAGLPRIAVLVPNHPGRAATEQPSLFWHIDRVPDPGTRLLLTLIDERSVEPLLEAELPTPAQAGIQRVELSEHGVRLREGSEYEWSVSIVIDPESRASDIIASAVIDRSDMADAPIAGAAGSTPEAAARSYAERGFWYDALAALSDAVRERPSDSGPKAARAALLAQVGLQAYAD
jgi:hypothetical protein